MSLHVDANFLQSYSLQPPRLSKECNLMWGKSSLICRYQRQQPIWWHTATRTPATTPSSPRCPPQRILSGRRSSSALCSESSQGSMSTESTAVQMCTPVYSVYMYFQSETSVYYSYLKKRKEAANVQSLVNQSQLNFWLLWSVSV